MSDEIEIVDRRPPWTRWGGTGLPPILVGQTVERRYRDGEEQSIIVRECHLARFMWRHKGDNMDITHYRIVCDTEGKPI